MRYLSGLVILAFLSWGCADKGDDKENPESQSTTELAPRTPPSGTLNIDLSVAGSSEEDLPEEAYLMGSGSQMRGGFFLKGLARAIQVNLFVKIQLIVPIIMLNAAQQEDPEFEGGRSWVWSFDVTDKNGIVYTSNLTGTNTGTDTGSWTMVVDTDSPNTDGCCENFTFFSGTVDSATQGSWTVYDPADETNIDRLFSITYDYSSDDDRSIEYTLHKERGAGEAFQSGSKISFTASGSQVTLVIDDIDQQNDETVIWNKDTLAGSYTDTSGEKGCWAPKSENYVDQSCDQ